LLLNAFLIWTNLQQPCEGPRQLTTRQEREREILAETVEVKPFISMADTSCAFAFHMVSLDLNCS